MANAEKNDAAAREKGNAVSAKKNVANQDVGANAAVNAAGSAVFAKFIAVKSAKKKAEGARIVAIVVRSKVLKRGGGPLFI